MVRASVLAVLIGAAVIGCGDPESNQSGGGGSSAPAAQTQQGGYIVGRVTMADGKPLPANVKDVGISIYGVSEAAEKVHYSPAVKPDGTYRQKVAGGQYWFNPARVTVTYGTAEYVMPLEPVGNLWNKNRDGAEGIVQDFVWKPNGPTPYGLSNGSDPNNATHWYGMSVGMRFSTYREDKKASSVAPPDGTKLIFTIKPTGPAIDGRTLETVTVERVYNAKNITPNDDLNDLPPANYEITGEAVLPDGTKKQLLFQGRGNYPNFVTPLKAPLERDGLIGGMWKQLAGWVIE